MRKLPFMFLGAALIMAGIVAIALAVARGDAELHFVLIFPVLSGTGAVFALGAGLLILGVLSAFIVVPLWAADDMEAGRPPQAAPPPPGRGKPRPGTAPDVGSHWGGVVLIGPIPIVFGSSVGMGRRMLLLAAAVTVLLAVLFLGALLL